MKRRVKEKKIKVVWKRVEGVSEEEVQRRLDRAYDILFTAVLEEQKKKR